MLKYVMNEHKTNVYYIERDLSETNSNKNI